MDKLKTGKQTSKRTIRAKWNVALNLWEVGYYVANSTFRVIYKTDHLPAVDLVSA